ncbi:UPF0057 membrane protein PA0567-like isoform X2 [Hibiscus syriacus]|uniref:UPF0057 membrane protein PA0567-like isoform X2 n=1 Tax=Hibiscus syriacus TaxID=106335 RepID=UPI0019218BAD|nr:UPF0057 membrane protein PA0567-like isoform X2 [Hibiscus syriacus]
MCICLKCGCFSCKTTSGQEEKKKAGCLDILLAIFVPPAGIYKKEGCSGRFWANVVLTVLGVAPGSIHAVVCVSSN